ncbi:peptidase MA family metallohydrolase [Myxococcus sp. AB036A]|uniref:peptidase MA family metallohydrolase n=1 Tax=Myxococcus sp. AB036A TaxID=2562793 RepID=UPI001891EFF3|nr:peptidase MA family metallohydrolase [Myxococcus sp. AB036A]
MSPAALLSALLLTAAPSSPGQKAKSLAASRAWEELYLAFSAGEASDVPTPQRSTVATALQKGCEALKDEDPVMAYSLGERATVYEESAGALRCLARAARKTDQRATAEAALRKGLAQYPKDGAFGLELGRLLMEEQDAVGAVAALEKVPAKSKEAAEAKRLLVQARAKTTEETAARREAERLELRMNGATSGRPTVMVETQPAVAGQGRGNTRSASLNYESGTGADGMRTRSNSRFVIRYFNNDRDFGQRAEYEGRIVAALDEAYDFTRSMLGEVRHAPVDIILYTLAEFQTHFGAARARAVAGLYSDNAIRINDAAELTPQTKATLVHEYVHAALDEFCGGYGNNLPVWLNEGLAEYVEWRYMGGEDPDRSVRNYMARAAKANSLPKLAQMEGSSLIMQRNPAIAYATSAVAVRELVKRGGTGRFLTMVREVGQGRPIDEALSDHYGKTRASLDEDVRAALQ